MAASTSAGTVSPRARAVFDGQAVDGAQFQRAAGDLIREQDFQHARGLVYDDGGRCRRRQQCRRPSLGSPPSPARRRFPCAPRGGVVLPRGRGSVPQPVRSARFIVCPPWCRPAGRRFAVSRAGAAESSQARAKVSPRGLVRERELAALEAGKNAGDGQVITLRKAVVIAGVYKRQRQYAVVDEVGGVDAGETLGNHRAHRPDTWAPAPRARARSPGRQLAPPTIDGAPRGLGALGGNVSSQTVKQNSDELWERWSGTAVSFAPAGMIWSVVMLSAHLESQGRADLVLQRFAQRHGARCWGRVRTSTDLASSGSAGKSTPLSSMVEAIRQLHFGVLAQRSRVGDVAEDGAGGRQLPARRGRPAHRGCRCGPRSCG